MGSYYYYMANDLFATGLLFLTHEIFILVDVYHGL